MYPKTHHLKWLVFLGSSYFAFHEKVTNQLIRGRSDMPRWKWMGRYNQDRPLDLTQLSPTDDQLHLLAS